MPNTAGLNTTSMSQQASLIARAGTAVGGLLTQAGTMLNGWFSPGTPQMVMAPQDPSAGVVGRRFQYKVGNNLTLTPRAEEYVTFAQLRFLSENCDVLRSVIETRKDQLERLEWQIVPKEGSTIKPDAPIIKEIEAFLQNPCTEGNFQWWFRALNEDLMVVDAVSIYKRRTLDGKLYSLDLMQPDTIKLVIDITGRRPQPPQAAYQQILYGIPAANYEAAGGVKDESGNWGIPFTTNEMLYRMQNPRSGHIYGYSRVEQILMTVNIAIRRQSLQLAYYTAGNIPDMLLAMPKEWTPEQIQTYQDNWDDMLADNLAERRKVKMVPGDSKVQLTAEEPQKDPAFDEWLARVICFCFSISPQPYVKEVNRATAGTAKATADEEGLQPIKQFWTRLFNEIITDEWGEDLEFKFKDEAHADAKETAEVHEIYVRAGIRTPDQARLLIGDDAMGGEAARLAITTAQGRVLIPTETDGEGAPVVPTAAEEAATAGHEAAAANGGVAPIQLDPNKTPPGDSSGDPKAAKGEDGNDTNATSKKEAGRTDNGALKKAHPAGSMGFMAEGSNANAVATLAPKLQKALADTGKDVAAQVKVLLDKLGKANDDEPTPAQRAQAIVEDLDLISLTLVGTEVGAETLLVFKTAAQNTLMAVGVSLDSDWFNQVDAASVEFTRVRGAELVTEITATTRKWLRDLITQSLENAVGVDALARKIEVSRAFSATRAQLIAETEVGNANGAGALDGLLQAQANGVALGKQWLVADAPCPICEANGEQGVIPLNQAFQSGDDYPLAHPNCRCTVIGVVSN